jgi:hypothetical protein
MLSSNCVPYNVDMTKVRQEYAIRRCYRYFDSLLLNYLVILWVTPVADNVRKTHMKICCVYIIDVCNWIQSGLITEDMISLTKKVLNRINLGKHVLSEELRRILMIIVSRASWLRKLIQPIKCQQNEKCEMRLNKDDHYLKYQYVGCYLGKEYISYHGDSETQLLTNVKEMMSLK